MYDKKTLKLEDVRQMLHNNELMKKTYSGADGGIKVIKGFLTILKGEQTSNLCKLIGSIIVGDASTSTEKEDTTRHWHMRLGHMSERVFKSYTKRVL